LVQILYISGTYMPAAGGAEISMFTLLRSLAALGYGVSVFTSKSVEPMLCYSYSVGIEVNYVETNQLQYALHRFCSAHHVDLIATQNLWAEQAIRVARQLTIPVVYFARAADGQLDISRGGEYETAAVIANSQHVANFVHTKWGRTATVIRSIVDLDEYKAPAGSRSFITMVNPIHQHKGGEIFRAVAAILCDRQFLAVQGWGHLRIGDAWNIRLLEDLASGLGSGTVWVPQDVDMTGLPNIHLWKSTRDMRIVYGETRILLVPSNNMESIPRVAIEAMSNGIPVIGSALGGLSELLATTGVLVRKYRDPDAWVEAIVSLDDAVRYSDISSSSQRHVTSIDFCAEVSKCIQIFSDTISGC
jgi:glycosyltransferase involved in cell wall biosynthesis